MNESTEMNVLYLCDSYKISHHLQYPAGTTTVYSYFESRGGKFTEVCFFGLQYILKRWMCGSVVTKEMVDEAKEFYQTHFKQDIFNYEGWMHIVEKHNGHLPLRIKAAPEGMIVPVRNVLFTVENTDPAVPWLTNWFETLLVQVWYPTTVCTNSREQKKVIAQYLQETTDSLDTIGFKLHDFGYRGASSVESAGIGGAAHLVNFVGTDTIAALQTCKKFYGCDMAGFSVPAAEHSTITTWKKEGETEAYKNMLKQFPTGIVSVVSDSYDLFNAISNIWGGELHDLVLERDGKGGVVIRPDSGDPATIVLDVLQRLEKKFVCSKNAKGFKELPSYLRVMQGDGICLETIEHILKTLKNNGWSAESVVFGSGGALLQKVDRDTQKCAYKCSHAIVNGEERIVYKEPATDSGKNSKKGRLTLERNEKGKIVTVEEGKGDQSKDLLRTVFENGELVIGQTLEEIRERAQLICCRQDDAEAAVAVAMADVADTVTCPST